MTLSRVHGLMKPIVMSFLVPCGHPYGTKTSQMGCALLIYHKCNQHSTGFCSGPFQDHSGPNSGMALFCRNKWSPEWQFWQDSLPKIILPDFTGMTGFRQESQEHDKDLLGHIREDKKNFVQIGSVDSTICQEINLDFLEKFRRSSLFPEKVVGIFNFFLVTKEALPVPVSVFDSTMSGSSDS